MSVKVDNSFIVKLATHNGENLLDSNNNLLEDTIMPHVTHYELDAKLDVIETRMDAKIDRIEATGKRIEATCEELKKEFRNGKWWAIGTAIAAVGLIFTVIQLNVSWQQNFLTSLDSRIGYVNSKVDALTPTQANPHK